MLEMCRRDQWSAHDLDWSRAPREMSREDEIAIVQYFTDMSVIERLAGALFREQERRTPDPTLKEIFRSFIRDETRHSQVAQMLADHYDVHGYRVYRPSTSLERFFPRFLDAVVHLSDDVANLYITVGELILDVALLRSINDFVKDPMSDAAMQLINRDESRHIAVDYHMVEYYSTDAYETRLRQAPRPSARERARALWTFTTLILHAKPFFHDVFFAPMQHMKAGHRLREAFRRFQLLESKPRVMSRPFARFMGAMVDVYAHPLARPVLGRIVTRFAGVEPELMMRMNDRETMARAREMTFDELAEDAVRAKYVAEA